MSKMMMNLSDGFREELKDLYSAEQQLLKALPKMEKKATDPKLKQALMAHLAETEGQIERLDEIAGILEEKLTGKTCKAMQGLLEEGKEVLENDSDNCGLIDTLLIGAARRVEHYEIAAYSTTCAIARTLGETEICKLLEMTLKQETNADSKLLGILESTVLPAAEEGEDTPEDLRSAAKGASTQGRGSKKSIGKAGTLCLALFMLSGAIMMPAAEAEVATEKKVNEKQANQYDPQNSGRNARDRNETRETADDQKLGGDEITVLSQLRKEIVANPDLSVNAHNVKILVEARTITLRGPVATAQERKWIEDTTSRICSGYSVINQLEVSHS